ncbi:MAG TPA: hypothetical protein VNI78_03355, partial [Vicinamibacterales bacterium]|nr:hypothetical protein [Vicinamibacterales bacterium]
MRTAWRTTWLVLGVLTFAAVFSTGPGQAAQDAPLVAAARADDVRAVRALLARGADVNQAAADGSTALLW